MSKESYTTTMPGGTLMTQYSGRNEGDISQDINPGMMGKSGTVEVRGDGTVVDRGLVTTNGSDLHKGQMTFWSANGAKRVMPGEVNDSCTVDVPGIGKMLVGAARRMGLLQMDAVGNVTDTSKAAMEQMQEGQEQDQGEAPVSFADEATDGTLMAMDEALGRDGTLAVSQSIIGHLTSAKWESPEQAFEKAGLSLAQRTGIQPEIAQAAVQEAYDGYRSACVQQLNKMGVDAEAVLDFAGKCSQQVRSELMQAILLGRGPQAMRSLVQRYKTRSKQ